ncbi:MAG: MmgE/PrpD family protein [Pseudomonadota bacterium]
MSETITDQLLALAQKTAPNQAQRMMRLSLFDWMACGIAGAATAEFEEFVNAQRALGQGECQFFGGGSVTAPVAALINGTLSHALDYDDTHFAHIGHPSVAILPAIIALGQDLRVDLETVVAAATIGVEASILVGLWLGRQHYQIGFHQTATAGAFGATLGACTLLNLGSDQSRHALGICASMASGLKAQFGTMSKPLNAGIAARSGLEAALWAQAGLTAAPDGLAGPLGFGATHHAEAAAVQLPKGAWRIESMTHKFHACCHGLHATLEALSGAEIDLAQIDTLLIRTHPRWMSVCNIESPQTGLEAKFSYAQTAAMLLLGHDTGDVASFDDAIVHDAEILALREKVIVREAPFLSETQVEISVKLLTGAVQRLRHDLLGALSDEMRSEKLMRKASALVGAARADALWRVTQGASLVDLAALMAKAVEDGAPDASSLTAQNA